MTDLFGRLTALAGVGPEIALEAIAMIIDGVGTGTEFSGEQLDRLGELAQELADKVRGIRETQQGGDS